jgi:hypothetical protein
VLWDLGVWFQNVLEKNHIIALKLPNWAQAFELLSLAKLYKCWQNLADTLHIYT